MRYSACWYLLFSKSDMTSFVSSARNLPWSKLSCIVINFLTKRLLTRFSWKSAMKRIIIYNYYDKRLFPQFSSKSLIKKIVLSGPQSTKDSRNEKPLICKFSVPFTWRSQLQDKVCMWLWFLLPSRSSQIHRNLIHMPNMKNVLTVFERNLLWVFITHEVYTLPPLSLSICKVLRTIFLSNLSRYVWNSQAVTSQFSNSTS